MALAKELKLKYVRAKFKLLSSVSKRKAAEKAFALFCTPQLRNTNALPPAFQEAEKLEFHFEGNLIRGYRWNTESKKKALILHGFESSVVNFEAYVTALIKKDYEVLAFDAPAHGRSTGKKITVIIYKDLIRYVWEKFGPIDAFVSHSFGGLALSQALEVLPHTAHTKVVMIAPAAETKTAIDQFFRLLQLGSGVRAEFENIIKEIGGKPSTWYSVVRAASNIRARVLVMQDLQDPLTPIKDLQPLMEQHYPNVQFIITEGLGHRRIYRDANSVKQIMEFL